MSLQNRYFIAIIPPGNISAQIRAFQNEFKESYKSVASLKNMPHITLKAPFITDALYHESILNWFRILPLDFKPFTIKLLNFGAFNHPKNPVIFVQPLLNNALHNLQKAVINSFQTSFPQIALHFYEQQFKPHITIAYRDLNYTEFERAWNDYNTKKYNAHFIADSVYLLQHNGNEWRVLAKRHL